MKCQHMLLEKDVPKRCPASWTPRQESHVADLGYYFEAMYPMAPYGVTDADWKVQLAEVEDAWKTL